MPWRRWIGCVILVLVLWPQPRTHAAGPPPTTVELLAIYVLAYDNRPASTLDLTPHYATTLNSLVTATANQPDRLAIVLADLHGVGDTHIRLVYNGMVFSEIGLPNANGVLSPTLTEYDTTDATTLAGFLRWATQRVQAPKRTFTYIGHGTPLVPATNVSAIFGPQPSQRIASLPPLPTNIGANPDLTDMHTPVGSPSPYGMLSPYALAQALGSVSSVQGFDLIDLLMCFATSIEEITEIAPFGSVIVGSPNYAFFEPSSPGKVLAALSPSQTPAQMGSSAIMVYDALIPATDHPRILVALDSQRIGAIKTAWDSASQEVYTLLKAQPVPTRQRLLNAYLASYKYDLSLCPPPEWELAAPDGLVDLYHFAVNLRQEFANVPSIVAAASQTEQALRGPNGAVIHRIARNDVPWFNPTVPAWQFSGTNPLTTTDDAAGISLYADLQGAPGPGGIQLSWHAHWYHDDTSMLDNLNPYQFIQDTTTTNGWDEVFQEYWEGQTITTAACTAQFPIARSPIAVGDVALGRQHQPVGTQVIVGMPTLLGATVLASQPLPSVRVRFDVLAQNTVVFSETIHTPYLLAGLNLVESRKRWTPSAPGAYTLRISVDIDNRLVETNEANNSRVFDLLASTDPTPPILSGTISAQIQRGPMAPIQLNHQQGTIEPTRLLVNLYQFEFVNGRWEPVLRGRSNLPAPALPAPVPIPLPSTMQPGAAVLHLWGLSPVGRSIEPVIVRFNYAPLEAVAVPEGQLYRFALARNDSVEWKIVNDSGNSTLEVWEPHILDGPTQAAVAVGDDVIMLPEAPLGGVYNLLVSGDVGATYTFEGTRNGTPMLQRNDSAPQASVAPQILEPPPEAVWTILIPSVQK